MNWCSDAPPLPRPCRDCSDRTVSCSTHRCGGIQPADAGNLGRRRDALDGGELSPASRSRLRHDSGSLGCDGRRRHRALPAGSAFPLALFITRSRRAPEPLPATRHAVPFWTSFLVRTYAWVFLLRDTGLFNTLLMATRHHPRAAAAALQRLAPCCSAWSTATCPSWCCRSLRRSSARTKALLEAAADLGAKDC